MAASQFRIRLPNRGAVLPVYRPKDRNTLKKAICSRILPCSRHSQTRRIHACFTYYGWHRDSEYPEHRSLYDTLGLPPYSTAPEIKRKYYELSKLHHPDRNQGDASANDRFVEISHAYKILSNSVSKTSYDTSLKRSQSKDDNRRYSQRGPVGGREAGGLSRRPVNPQGPPPSYYRDRPIRSGTKTSTPFASRFNWDEKYRQHYVYQERFRKGSGLYSKPVNKPNYSDLSDFCFRAVAVGSCILLVGVLGRWFVTETGSSK